MSVEEEQFAGNTGKSGGKYQEAKMRVASG